MHWHPSIDMTLDELISDLQTVRNRAGKDTPIRVVINDNDLGCQYEIIHAPLTEGFESPMTLVLAGRPVAQMDWPSD
jgi:hypothetical protein